MTSSHKTQRLRSKKYTTWPRSYSIILTATLLAAAVFISSVILQRQASADITLVYSNGFESDTTGWAGSGTITRTVSGANGIISATDSYHAVVTGQPGPNTQFGGYGSSWPGDWQASIDVYFDPAWDAGTGFIYTVATNNISGTHLRDFALNAGVLNDETTGNVNQFVILADTAGSPTADPLYQIKAMPAERRGHITEAGWYTIQHAFNNVDGKLIVTVSVLDSDGATVYSQAIDYEWLNDRIPEDVGGNRYGWFTHNTVDGGLAIDNTSRTVSSNAHTVTADAEGPVTLELAADQTMTFAGVSSGAVTVPKAVTITDSVNDIAIVISEGTEINASSPSWDGSLMAPQKVSPTNLPDHIIDVTTAVKVGSNVPLEFSHPVKVVIPGAAGRYAGYINHSNVFFDIETECGNTPAATLVGGVKECYLSEGDDLIVWTLHFSTFVAYETVGVPNTGLVHNAQTLVPLGVGIAGALVVALSFYKIARATRS